MPTCGPSCAVPSCASVPVFGFGSAGLGGLGGLGGGLSNGFGALVGSGVPSASLGILSDVAPSCVNQIPPAEVVIQPPACVVTMPGAILSASCEPLAVGGYSPCAVENFGFGFGRGLNGGRNRHGFLGHRSFTCYTPC